MIAERLPDPIAAQLRAERERRGMSLRDVAAAMGKTSGASICDWERGNKEPTLGRLRAWAAALGQDVQLGQGECEACGRVRAIPVHPEMVPNAAEEWQNGFRWGWHYAVKAVREKIEGVEQR